MLCDFDEGPADLVVLRKEFLSKTGAIVRATAYTAKGTKPLSGEEEQQLDIVIRAMMSYIGRNRLQTAVEILAFHDNNGYPNFAYHLLSKELNQARSSNSFFCGAEGSLSAIPTGRTQTRSYPSGTFKIPAIRSQILSSSVIWPSTQQL